VVAPRVCFTLLLAAFLGACGTSHERATTAAARSAASCTDHLPLDTVLDDVPRNKTPRPLILALHGARQGGYGMQRYTGLSDDATGFLVAYPTTCRGC
jgi:poly(3-hydroxybutyrate) depolymerase